MKLLRVSRTSLPAGRDYRTPISVGSALDPANPVDVVTMACIVPEPPSIAWAPLPAHKPGPHRCVWGEPTRIANFGVLSSGKFRSECRGDHFSELANGDVSQRLSPQSVFANAISSGTCAEQIAERDVLFVRGVIYAKETFSSTKGFNAFCFHFGSRRRFEGVSRHDRRFQGGGRAGNTEISYRDIKIRCGWGGPFTRRRRTRTCCSA